MPESLFILPDSFDDDQIAQVWRHWDNPEVLLVAGDVDKVDQFTEGEAVAIFANYGQVREYLHKKTLNRGFFSAAAPGAKGRKGGKGKEKGRRKGDGQLAIQDRPSPFSALNTARPIRMFEGAPHRQNQMRAMRTTWTLGAHMHQSA